MRPSPWQEYLGGFSRYEDLEQKVTIEFSREGFAPSRVWTARIAEFPHGPVLAAHIDFGICYDNHWLALESEWRKARELCQQFYARLSTYEDALRPGI